MSSEAQAFDTATVAVVPRLHLVDRTRIWVHVRQARRLPTAPLLELQGLRLSGAERLAMADIWTGTATA